MTDNSLLHELVARYKEVIAQLARPAFREDLRDLSLAYIRFGDLCAHCDALGKFGEDHAILRKIARCCS